MQDRERAIVLVKAWPQPSKRYGETVCCAGVTPEGQWRRLFPIRYRHLAGDQKFVRWDIVEYRPEQPRDDTRSESRRVAEDTLKVVGSIPGRDRSVFFDRLVQPSYAAAARLGQSLALVRPSALRFRWRPKSQAEIDAEQTRREAALAQGQLFHADVKAMGICPFHLRIHFEDADGPHGMVCGDWETPAAFFNLRRSYGEAAALEHLRSEYEERYAASGGVALALGTVKKRPAQWTLLGVIRLDEPIQPSFNF